MQAFERGEEIEVSYVKQDKWTNISNPDWSWGAYNYRIKAKSKQTITIEKWLIYDNLSKSYSIAEESNIDCYINDDRAYLSKVKLLDTYEVEI